jgi:hypothetical protein
MTAPVKKPRRAYTRYSRALSDEICLRLAEGDSLITICKRAGMPEMSTVRKWIIKDVDGFTKRHAEARQAQADYYVDQITRIADEPIKRVVDQFGISRLDGAHVQQQRMRIDTRKWYAGKVAPRRWGEKQLHEHTGADGGAIKAETLVSLPPDEAYKRMLGYTEPVKLPAWTPPARDVEDVDDDEDGRATH